MDRSRRYDIQKYLEREEFLKRLEELQRKWARALGSARTQGDGRSSVTLEAIAHNTAFRAVGELLREFGKDPELP